MAGTYVRTAVALALGCLLLAIAADALEPSGWVRAHATFYGGSDASGTMGDRKTDKTWCKPGVSVTVTATNFCPPNWDLPSDKGGWCNPPRPHFDMAQPAWEKIGVYRGGIIPIIYQRVPCVKKGGVRFTISGHDYFELVLPTNVAAAGSIRAMDVRGSKSGDWMAMAHNWGANWHSLAYLNGQGLSFRVTITDGQTLVFSNVVPPSWRFGQTFSSNLQFK
ncbi:unnamed protein product [Triticum turgidum subsp. durum]|uniref:Expansin n=1 Tax=Triticum turgidum subsp. durum TaxID=4567 RepID=A0A9R0XJW7_TRITD|nr:unnamed protein product [Triticum turgidum subsp. durum]